MLIYKSYVKLVWLRCILMREDSVKTKLTGLNKILVWIKWCLWNILNTFMGCSAMKQHRRNLNRLCCNGGSICIVEGCVAKCQQGWFNRVDVWGDEQLLPHSSVVVGDGLTLALLRPSLFWHAASNQIKGVSVTRFPCFFVCLARLWFGGRVCWHKSIWVFFKAKISFLSDCVDSRSLNFKKSVHISLQNHLVFCKQATIWSVWKTLPALPRECRVFIMRYRSVLHNAAFVAHLWAPLSYLVWGCCVYLSGKMVGLQGAGEQ